MSRLYLTIAEEERPPEEGGGYVAVISDGSPQRGDTKVKVLSIGVFPTHEAARAWYAEQLITRPWEPRS